MTQRIKHGFTLIETMIVVLIIAVMSAVITLNVAAPNYSRFLANAEKFAATLSVLSDQAIYTSSIVSCKIETTALSCRSYRDGEWNELNLKQLITWGWPQGLQVMQVLVNGNPIHAKEHLRFVPSGDNGGISIQVGDGVFSAWIDSDLAGKFRVSS
jgi:type II secretion system protein H